MADERAPHQIIAELAAARSTRTDDEVLAELASLPPLADEGDPRWDSGDYWQQSAYPYLALVDVCATRRLRPAIKLLLDRACYGDPGEIMRGLRHGLEAIVNPDWQSLADICLEAARSPRLGTRLWAIDELTILEDPRAKPIFEEAARSGPEEIRWRSGIGLERLAKAGMPLNPIFGEAGGIVQELHRRPTVSHPSRWPSVLRGVAVGFAVGVAWAAVLGPLTDGPPSLWLSFAGYTVGFSLTGALVGAVRQRPEGVGLVGGWVILSVLAVIIGPKDGWVVLWVIVFGGSGLVGGAVVGGLYRLFRGPDAREAGPDARRPSAL